MKTMIFETAFNTYTSESVLGEGGSGIVYAVRDNSSQPLAAKLLKLRNINTDRLKRFKNEVFFCAKNLHSNIMTVVDFGFYEIEGSKCPFYVMPRYNKTLRNLMNEGIEPGQVCPIFTQILDGVEAAHLKGVFHRDLKPENVLLDSDNNKFILADFGVAHFSEAELSTLVETGENARLANFQYAAPEQKMRGVRITHQADMFALGLILNELFTKKIPQGTDWEKIEVVAPDFSYLDPIVHKMLNQDPSRRHQSVDEVKLDITVSGKKYITRQKLSETNKEVVPLPEADDVFISNPVKVTAVDYSDGTLKIQLNQMINGEWLRAFNSAPGCGWMENYEQGRFDFQGDTASVRLMSHSNEVVVQRIVDQFKTWLTQTSEHLKGLRRASAAQKQREEVARFEERKREEERRLKILSNTKI